jgi:hypothetical protein
MTKIIKGQFGPKPTAGNPNPGDPKQPSPPTYQGVDPAKPGDDRTTSQLIDVASGKPIPLTPDQHKALSHILAGTAFVFIAIKETDGGADFYTALHGEPTVLRNAQDELPAVIARLYAKKGVTS